MLPLQLIRTAVLPIAAGGGDGPIPPGTERVESMVFFLWLLILAVLAVSAVVIMLRSRRRR